MKVRTYLLFDGIVCVEAEHVVGGDAITEKTGLCIHPVTAYFQVSLYLNQRGLCTNTQRDGDLLS